jgi:hypothetical protein
MKRSMMSNYYSEQESLATEFANGSGLPFVYHYTGGGCDAKRTLEELASELVITQSDMT